MDNRFSLCRGQLNVMNCEMAMHHFLECSKDIKYQLSYVLPTVLQSIDFDVPKEVTEDLEALLLATVTLIQQIKHLKKKRNEEEMENLMLAQNAHNLNLHNRCGFSGLFHTLSEYYKSTNVELIGHYCTICDVYVFEKHDWIDHFSSRVHYKKVNDLTQKNVCLRSINCQLCYLVLYGDVNTINFILSSEIHQSYHLLIKKLPKVDFPKVPLKWVSMNECKTSSEISVQAKPSHNLSVSYSAALSSGPKDQRKSEKPPVPITTESQKMTNTRRNDSSHRQRLAVHNSKTIYHSEYSNRPNGTSGSRKVETAHPKRQNSLPHAKKSMETMSESQKTEKNFAHKTRSLAAAPNGTQGYAYKKPNRDFKKTSRTPETKALVEDAANDNQNAIKSTHNISVANNEQNRSPAFTKIEEPIDQNHLVTEIIVLPASVEDITNDLNCTKDLNKENKLNSKDQESPTSMDNSKNDEKQSPAKLQESKDDSKQNVDEISDQKASDDQTFNGIEEAQEEDNDLEKKPKKRRKKKNKKSKKVINREVHLELDSNEEPDINADNPFIAFLINDNLIIKLPEETLTDVAAERILEKLKEKKEITSGFNGICIECNQIFDGSDWCDHVRIHKVVESVWCENCNTTFIGDKFNINKLLLHQIHLSIDIGENICDTSDK